VWGVWGGGGGGGGEGGLVGVGGVSARGQSVDPFRTKFKPHRFIKETPRASDVWGGKVRRSGHRRGRVLSGGGAEWRESWVVKYS